MMHTPTPWRVRFYRTAPTIDCVQGAPERPEKYGREIINRMARPSSDRAKADARRIVACVNALEGFDIAAIEAGVVKQLVEALRQSETLLRPYAKTMPDNATSEAFHRISTAIDLIAPSQELQDQG
jgi:hypothetical protein